ncbi:hypothetical protein AX14_002558 [Amanita brunnescens Koide BX004]|nr:hypothetical protein AX14_002558 [Amanita brunnescens Koide BX004]
MVFFPKVQKKVQEDLDRVVGPPPYFAVPDSLTDDEYNGLQIPKSSETPG